MGKCAITNEERELDQAYQRALELDEERDEKKSRQISTFADEKLSDRNKRHLSSVDSAWIYRGHLVDVSWTNGIVCTLAC